MWVPTQESTNLRQVIPSAVVIDALLFIQDLPGVPMLVIIPKAAEVDAKWIIIPREPVLPVLIDEELGAAQVVGDEPIHASKPVFRNSPT